MGAQGKKIVIIGGGVAGLCAGVYAQKNGYQAEVLEMQDGAGGLATSWQRDGYTFETCLHWLLGSNPDGEMHARWKEVCDIDRLKFFHAKEFVRLETEQGESFSMYSDIDWLEEAMLKRAPQDAEAVRHFTESVRRLREFKMPDPAGGLLGNVMTMLHDLPFLPLMHEISSVSGREYGTRFTDPLLRSFFGDGESSELSAVALIFSLAWLNSGDAGYAIGGSQALIRLIVERLTALGGTLRLGARVERILVENDTAIGVQLVGGEKIMADWVISAADGHTTQYGMLEGKYIDKAAEKHFAETKTFPSYLQVSLGVAQDMAEEPGFVTRMLDVPLEVDPGTKLEQVSFRIFNFDPTFAPAGKTAVTCFLPTRGFAYWVHLQKNDPAAYKQEKERVAQAVIAILERRMPGVREKIEVVDVSTPATVIGYTGNWQGSTQGWMITPGSGYAMLPNTLPGLQRFLMVGHWTLPGGGLPSGLITSQHAIRQIVSHNWVPLREEALEIDTAGRKF